MTPRYPERRHLGYRAPDTKSSDKGMSPQRPYTGDGRTTRSIFDRIELIMKATPAEKPPRAPKQRRVD